MKKMLLLSVVASTMIMAGGDISPVEKAMSNWKFSGQGVVYYQTQDTIPFLGTGDLFDQEMSFANAGLQLRATNDDLMYGIGFGVELTGLGTLGLEEDVVFAPMQNASHYTGFSPNNDLNGAYFSQLYLTYGFDNTSIKIGRQELPKALSPFAFSEDWNVFKNTFDALLVVNTDIQDTVLVGAWVRDANKNGYAAWDIVTGAGVPAGNMNEFDKLNDDAGVWMLTAQNKSFQDLTLTGSIYYAGDYAADDSLVILWADAQYKMNSINIGLQGGTVSNDFLDANGGDSAAFGAKVSGKLDIVNLCLSYSHVNDSAIGIFNVGGSGSALYTDMLAEEVIPFNPVWPSTMNFRNDNNKFVIRANADLFGGNLGGAYGYTDYEGGESTNELDISYSTNITESTSLAATYAYINSGPLDESGNVIRVVARYNF